MKILDNSGRLLLKIKDRVQFYYALNDGRVAYRGRVMVVRGFVQCNHICEWRDVGCLLEGKRFLVGSDTTYGICAGFPESHYIIGKVPRGGLRRFGYFDPKHPPFVVRGDVATLITNYTEGDDANNG